MMFHLTQPVFGTCASTHRVAGRTLPLGLGYGVRACLVLLLGLYLSASALAVAENWHHSLHEDEGGADHQCLVTFLQSGQCAANGGSEIPLLLPSQMDIPLSWTVPTALPSATHGLRHGRAPPL